MVQEDFFDFYWHPSKGVVKKRDDIVLCCVLAVRKDDLGQSCIL